MKLSDAKIKAATVPEGKKQVRLSDGGGLYVQASPKGKYWRMNYRFGIKQKTLALGVYPQVSLKEARTRREASKKLLEQNIDPSQKKQADRRKAVDATKTVTFEGIATEWISKRSVKWVDSTIKNTQARLDKHIFPWIGSLPIDEIEAQDIFALIQRVEKRGTIETAHRLKMLCSQIFRYCIAMGLTKYDPTIGLQGALVPVVVKHRATITEPREVVGLLRAIQSFKGTFVVQCALQITPYVFLRPGELRGAEWEEFDFDNSEWRIPAVRMKMKVMHVVPLATQVLEILRELQPVTSSGRYVFPSYSALTNPSLHH